MNGAFSEQVRQRAYEMWMADGCVEGRAHDHWISAERKLIAEAALPKAKRAAAPKRATTKSAACKGAAVKESAAPGAKASAAKLAPSRAKSRATHSRSDMDGLSA